MKEKKEIPKVVHDFLSRNGQKGGATTRRLIELGKLRAKKRPDSAGRETRPNPRGRRASQ